MFGDPGLEERLCFQVAEVLMGGWGVPPTFPLQTGSAFVSRAPELEGWPKQDLEIELLDFALQPEDREIGRAHV